MPFTLFGFSFKSPKKPNTGPSFAPPNNDDGALLQEQAGASASVLDLSGSVRNEIELISKYREIAERSEVDGAIKEIVNESIVTEETKSPVTIVLDKLNYDETIKQKISDEFDNILNLLDFTREGQEIFRRWYVDGRLFFHMVIDPQHPEEGLKELIYIDPRRIKPIINIQSSVSDQGVPVTEEIDRYYLYSQFGIDNSNNASGVKVAWDSICYVHSGIQDGNNTMILGHLNKAIKPANMLAMTEDASVIYRLCLVGDTRISTPNGWKYISDIVAGDTVYSYDISKGVIETKVKSSAATGTKLVYKVRSRHHEITGTSNHPILVRDNNTGVISYVDICQLIPRRHQLIRKDIIQTPDVIPFPKVREDNYILQDKSAWVNSNITGKESLIRSVASKIGAKATQVINFLYGLQTLPKPVAIALAGNIPIALIFDEKVEGWTRNELTLPPYVDEDFAKLFGFLIGDGSVGDYTITFAEGIDANQNEYYADLLRRYFGNSKRHATPRSYGNYTTSNTLGAELLHQMGYIDGFAHKRIPEWVFRASDTIKKAFIMGLCDADGCIRYTSKGTWFCTIELGNKKLIEDVKELWTRLGLSSGKLISRNRQGGVITGRQISRSRSWQVTLTQLPLDEYENILTVEALDQQPVFDFEVDHPSHNFIANGVCVHNSRAPERRIFYIDVGNMSTQKANEYMKGIMNKYRNKMVYDANTGEVKDDKKFMSFLEDYWLPRREGNRGTQIENLPGGENLGEMADIEYFKEKLYQSLNVPIGRLNSEGGFNMGRSAEITRDEVKFGKFVYSLRTRFEQLFDVLLSTQLMLKGVIAREDWLVMRQKIHYDFLKDTSFSELKNLEILRERFGAVDALITYIGKFISARWIRQNILMQTDEEMALLDREMAQEKNDPRYQALEALTDPMGGAGQIGPDGMPMGMQPQLGDGGLSQIPQLGAGDQDSTFDGSQADSDEDEGEPYDPTQNVSRNVEALWRR